MLDSVAPLTTPESVSPDSKQTANSRERMAVLTLAMSAFVLNLNSNVMGALLPFIKSEFDFADDQPRDVTVTLRRAGLTFALSRGGGNFTPQQGGGLLDWIPVV